MEKPLLPPWSSAGPQSLPAAMGVLPLLPCASTTEYLVFDLHVSNWVEMAGAGTAMPYFSWQFTQLCNDGMGCPGREQCGSASVRQGDSCHG